LFLDSGGQDSAMRFGSLLLVVWLAIGFAAAYQRDYFKDAADCGETSTIVLTIVAGPLNYVGVNPKADCPDVKVPQPSK
jgi:hypothetical protein